MRLSPLALVARLVQPHLEEVEARIAQQAAAFDPALEGYVVYAVGGRGKRLRPLLALLAGGATGQTTQTMSILPSSWSSSTSPRLCMTT